MNLTICVVTKGREEFLDELLLNLKEVSNLPFVRIFLFLNGTSQLVSDQIRDWSTVYPERVKLFTFTKNEPGPNRVWNILNEEKTDWVIFPGDDDLLDASCLSNWYTDAQKSIENVGYAFSVEKIDQGGKSIGIVSCSALPSNSREVQIAEALHEPPFIWPSLIFRFSSVYPGAPNSRYTLDWWVQVRLLLAGDVQVVNEVMLKYRVHGGQESMLSTLSRKFLEATICIKDLVQSKEFTQSIKQLSPSQRLIFLKSVIDNPPIYGDPVYSTLITNEIISVLIASANNTNEIEKYLALYTFANDVVLKPNQLQYFFPFGSAENSPSNVMIVPVEVCEYSSTVTQSFKGAKDFPVLQVSCQHSLKNQKLVIPCKSFVRNLETDADILAMSLSSQLELSSRYQVKLSSGERFIVHAYRKAQRKILRKFASRMKKFRLRKASAL